MANRRSSRAAGRGPVKQWGFFVYIAGDNDLSDAGLEDVAELCAAGGSPAVHIGVEIDTLGDHTGSIRYEIREPDWTGASHRVVIERLPEKDSGDPATLSAFARWALERYACRRRILVVWNHGTGFRSPRRDIGFDDFGSSLDMPEVERALARAGIGARKKHGKLSILGFDACLMGMVEIAHHLRTLAEFVVGSQQTEPGDGWPYDAVLRRLHAGPEPERLAAGIVEDYIADYKHRGIEDVTQSVIETAKTPAVIAALGRLGDALGAGLEWHRMAIRGARARSQSFAYADYVDLIHVAREIAGSVEEAAIRSAAASLQAAAAAAIRSSKTYGSAVSAATGLSVWFPADAATFLAHRSKYLRLDCNRGGSGWSRFLDQYFGLP